MSNSVILMSQWPSKRRTLPLLDVPCSWLDSKVCTNYPSAPPIPDGNLMSGFPSCFPQQPLKSLEHQRYAPQQPQQLPQPVECQGYQPQRVREYHRDMDYTKQQSQRPELQRQNKQLYPQPTEQQASEPSYPKPFKGLDDKRKTKNAFSKGCYDSTIESEDEY